MKIKDPIDIKKATLIVARNLGRDPEAFAAMSSAERVRLMKDELARIERDKANRKARHNGRKMTLTLGAAKRESPTPEAHQHGNFIVQGDGNRAEKLTRNTTSCLLDVYRYGYGSAPSKITQRQHEAGVHFAEQYYRSGFVPVGKDAIVVMMTLGILVRCDGADSGIERTADAHRFLNRVRDSLEPGSYNLLVGVTIHEKPLGEDRYGGRRRWDAFRSALDHVADVLILPEYHND